MSVVSRRVARTARAAGRAGRAWSACNCAPSPNPSTTSSRSRLSPSSLYRLVDWLFKTFRLMFILASYLSLLKLIYIRLSDKSDGNVLAAMGLSYEAFNKANS